MAHGPFDSIETPSGCVIQLAPIADHYDVTHDGGVMLTLASTRNPYPLSWHIQLTHENVTDLMGSLQAWLDMEGS